MSKYTTEVRFLCESLAEYTEQQGYGNIDSILNVSAPLLFDFDFPIFDEDYRLELEKKILRHYYTREISEETVGLWKLRLSDRLNMIMPYYNQLYASELIEFDPMKDTNLDTSSTTTLNKTDTGSSGLTSKTVYDETTTISETGEEAGEYSETTGTTGSKNTSDSGMDTTITSNESGNTRTSNEETTQDSNTTITDEQSSTNERTINYTKTDEATTGVEEGTTTNSTVTESYSDTPQGTLENVWDDTYLTSARYNTEYTQVDHTNVITYTDNQADETTEFDNNIFNKTESDSTGATGTKYNKTVDNGSLSGEVLKETSSGGTTEYSEDGTKDGVTSSSSTKDTEGSKESTKTVTNTGSTTDTTNSGESYVQKIAGKRSLSSFSKYLIEFRQTFLNIDNMIINELGDLFINLW